MLSTILYSACTSMEIIMGMARLNNSGGMGAVPIREADRESLCFINYFAPSIMACAARTIKSAQTSLPIWVFRHKS